MPLLPLVASGINQVRVNRKEGNTKQEWSGFAPGRVEWLGNHTDYNDGLVLGIGLDAGTTVRGCARPDKILSMFAADLGCRYEAAFDNLEPVTSEPWANYVLGVAAGFIKRGAVPLGLDIEIRSNVPLGAGLSSSAALECSTSRMLQQAWGTDFDDLELARIGQESEHLFAGVRCGLLDQIVSLFSRRHHAVFLDARSLEIQRVPVPDEARFVIAQTGVKHELSDGAYNARRAECEEAAHVLGVGKLREADMAMLERAATDGRLSGNPLKRARHIVGENARVEAAIAGLRREDLAAVGLAMNESHESSRTLFENSCAELDALAALARGLQGCFGARLTGGGFGGAVLALVRAGEDETFVRELTKQSAPVLGHEPQVMVTEAGGSAI